MDMQVNKRANTLLRTLLLALLFGLLAACASNSPTRHYFMQGQVLAVDGTVATVCVGTRNGAEVGQVLGVIRHEPVGGDPKQPAIGFSRRPMGQVRITAIFDEHYAKAELVSGEVHVNDSVELEH